MSHQHRKTCTHLPGIPSSRQYPSLVSSDSVLGVHQHGFESVDSFETNLYSGVLEYLLERLTQTWKVGDRYEELFLYFMSCVWVYSRDHFCLTCLICQLTIVGNCYNGVPYLDVLLLLGSLGLDVYF